MLLGIYITLFCINFLIAILNNNRFIIFNLSVQDALALLEECSEDQEIVNADIIIVPHTYENYTYTDSRPEVVFTVDNLSVSYFCASILVKIIYKIATIQEVVDQTPKNYHEKVSRPKKHKSENNQ